MIGGFIKVLGEKRLLKNLSMLEPRVQRKVTKQAISKATKPMVAATRKMAKAVLSKKRSFQLDKSIGRVMRTKRKSSVLAVIGPRDGFGIQYKGRPHDPSKIGHLVELGHRTARGGKLPALPGRKPRKVEATGQHVGDVPPHPFEKPAFDATANHVKNVALVELAAGIEREASKG